MKIEKAVEGLSKYIEERMFPAMVNWQRVAFRTFMNRVKRKPELLTNGVVPFLNFFEYADEMGDINIDVLIADFRGAVSTEGNLVLEIPMLGLKYSLSPNDADDLCRYLKHMN